MRPLTKGFIIGGITLVLFYFFILFAYLLVGDSGVSLTGDTVGVIEVRGVISNSQPIVDRLMEYRDDANIRAIILRIDSPGGAVGPSQEIYTEVRRTTQVKPVVASLGGTAASGGYYIAAACTKIVANPGTLTGSIGVIMEFLNMEGLFEWVGLKSTTIKSGEYKDIGHYTRRMTPKEAKLLQEVVDDVHRQFMQAVADGRNIPAEEVAAFADGRIFTGSQALELNLVDNLGNFEDAVFVASDLAGIQYRPEVLWPKRKKISLMDLMIDDFGSKLAEGVLNRLSEGKTSLLYQ